MKIGCVEGNQGPRVSGRTHSGLRQGVPGSWSRGFHGSRCGSRGRIRGQEYVEAGAKYAKTAAAVFDAADMIVKVKEPQPSEYASCAKDRILFT
jgi:hypothetical protein